ncbi:hypothetical protein AB0N09_42875 [Streptomyces erythrochromogenes]|uniref:hypothetical protein n=1 Tax=Streptomyces erythrochromogenes TaxID=285574 RepID=UPI00343AB21F
MTAATHHWHLQGSADHSYSGSEAGRLLRHRRDWATLDTWFESDAGRLLNVVTNGERAMVVLLTGAGDPGEHLVDPRARGTSDGYALSNGQVDSHADRDTVPFDVAARAVGYFIEYGTWPADVAVEDDRG